MNISKALIVSLISVGIGISSSAIAMTPEEKGLAIAVEDDKRDNGFHDYKADSIMILKNRQGDESTRYLRFKTLEMQSDGDKNLVVFDKPRDIKKTAFLNFTHSLGDDDQWLYLPALKRVKRISSSNKSGPFVGSEFAYEDITSQEVKKYTYKWLRDEEYQGQKSFVVEQVPAYENSGYTRRVVWIDAAEYRTLKVDFYDRKNSLLKTLTYDGYNKYLNQYWYPDEMYMVNHQTGKSTQLSWKNYTFRAGLKDKHFNKNSLKRAR
jgi:outer membrane lipoprotein-sorting protein